MYATAAAMLLVDEKKLQDLMQVFILTMLRW